MKKILILTLIALTNVVYAQLPEGAVDSLKLWFPKGAYKVNFLRLVPHQKASQIGWAVNDSIKKHPEWFTEHIKSLKPGEEVPYHEKLGVSKTDYEFYLKHKNDQQYILRGKTRIDIHPDSLGEITRFDASGQILGMKFVELNYKNQTTDIVSNLSPKAQLEFDKDLSTKNSDNIFEVSYLSFLELIFTLFERFSLLIVSTNWALSF